MSTQLVVLHKNRAGPHVALAILSHLSFVLNLSSTLGALLLANKFAALVDISARRETNTPQSGYLVSSGTFELLRVYGLKTPWYFMVFHCKCRLFNNEAGYLLTSSVGLTCTFLGAGCLFAQITVYVWQDEFLSVKITITCVVAFASIPLLLATRLATN